MKDLLILFSVFYCLILAGCSSPQTRFDKDISAKGDVTVNVEDPNKEIKKSVSNSINTLTTVVAIGGLLLLSKSLEDDE